MIGERLIKLRGNKTQKYVAEKLGISRARYSHYENNHVQPDYELLQKIADYYNVSVDYLLGRTDKEFNPNEKKFLSELSSIPIDELIEKYPLVFKGEKLELSDEDKWALLVFIKTLQEMKKEKER